MADNVVSPDMNIDRLLQEARAIWGQDRLTLDEIVIRMGVVLGDLNRAARDMQEGSRLSVDDVKKEMGNMLFSLIRWCDDLGYSPQECIEAAKQAQRAYRQRTT